MECPKCGEKLHDWADYCDACGCDMREYNSHGIAETRVYSGQDDGVIEYKPVTPSGAQRLQRRKKDKKGALISVILVCSMLLVFFVVGAYAFRNVYESPYERKIGDMLEIANGEVTTIEDFMQAMFPEVIREDYYSILSAEWELQGYDYDEAMKDANITFADQVDSMCDATGNRYSYKVKTERKLGKAELKDRQEAYKNATKIIEALNTTGEKYKAEHKVTIYEAYMKMLEDFTTLEFSEGYELEVEITAENISTRDKEKETVEIYVVKTDGEWMIDFVRDLDKYTGFFSVLN